MRVKQNGYYGYVDENGALVIPTIYLSAEPFANGKAFVNWDDEYVFILNPLQNRVPINFKNKTIKCYSEEYKKYAKSYKLYVNGNPDKAYELYGRSNQLYGDAYVTKYYL